MQTFMPFRRERRIVELECEYFMKGIISGSVLLFCPVFSFFLGMIALRFFFFEAEQELAILSFFFLFISH